MIDLTKYKSSLGEQFNLLMLAVSANIKNFKLYSIMLILQSLWYLLASKVEGLIMPGSVFLPFVKEIPYGELLVLFVVYSLVHVIFASMLIVLASMIAMGDHEYKVLKISDARHEIARSAGKVFYPTLFVYCMSALGLLVFVVGGLFYFYRTILAPYIVLVEKIPLKLAIKRSVKLTQGTKFNMMVVHFAALFAFLGAAIVLDGNGLELVINIIRYPNSDLLLLDRLELLCFLASFMLAPVVVTSTALFYHKCLFVEEGHKNKSQS